MSNLDSKKEMTIYDEVTIQVDEGSQKAVEDAAKGDNEGKAKNLPSRLRVKIAATHCGKVNGNGNMYTHDGMKRSAKTWTKPFHKPVVKHHDARNTDPMGRVINAVFMDLPRIQDAKKKSLKTPTGYIQVLAEITDRDAIEKILDRRYLTVSIGGSAQSVKCSVCKQDIINDGICEHEKGDTYDGELCYWEIGGMKYNELSWVNVPADDQASVESIQAMNDAVEDSAATSAIILPDDDTEDTEQEEGALKEKKTQAPESTQETPGYLAEDFTYSDEDKAKFAELGVADRDEDEASEGAEDAENGKPEDQEDEEPQTEETQEDTAAEDDESKDEEDADGDTESKVTDELSSTADLPDDAFCGPERSFPVPDAAHASQAKANLVASELSSDAKKRIMAKVVARQKALGAGGFGTSDDVTTDSTISLDDLLTAMLDEVQYSNSLFDQLQDSVKEAKAIKDAALDVEATTDNEKTLKAALQAAEDEKKTLETEIQTLKDSLTEAHNDRDAMKDTAQVAQTEVHALLASRVVDMRIQLGKPEMADVLGATGDQRNVLREAHIAEMKERSLDSLRDAAKDLVGEMTDDLGEPREMVEPTGTVDKDNQGFSFRPDSKRAAGRPKKSLGSQLGLKTR